MVYEACYIHLVRFKFINKVSESLLVGFWDQMGRYLKERMKSLESLVKNPINCNTPISTNSSRHLLIRATEDFFTSENPPGVKVWVQLTSNHCYRLFTWFMSVCFLFTCNFKSLMCPKFPLT